MSPLSRIFRDKGVIARTLSIRQEIWYNTSQTAKKASHKVRYDAIESLLKGGLKKAESMLGTDRNAIPVRAMPILFPTLEIVFPQRGGMIK